MQFLFYLLVHLFILRLLWVCVKDENEQQSRLNFFSQVECIAQVSFVLIGKNLCFQAQNKV